MLGHEGGCSPDGKSYWAAGLVLGSITAIDVTDPKLPKIAFFGNTGFLNHGFSFNKNGTRIYIARQLPASVEIFDVSDIQDQVAVPQLRKVGSVAWDNPKGIGQMTIPVTWETLSDRSRRNGNRANHRHR